MNERVLARDNCDCIMGFQGGCSEIIKAPTTMWDFQLFENEETFLRGIIKDAWQCKNLVTNQGKNSLNEVYFRSGTQITAWYIALFSSNTTPEVAMTYATPIYTETILYADNRKSFVPAGSVNQSITNVADRAVFTMNDAVTIYGCALVGGGSAAATKNDKAGGGTLYCASKFAVAKDVIATNILYIGMTISQT